MAASDLGRYQANLQDEIDGIALYQALSKVEADPTLAGIYGRLAEAEERHAELWRGKIRDAGGSLGPERPAWRTRVLIRLARAFGPALILPTISGREEADRTKYSSQPDAKAAGLSAEEQSHARLFRAIAPEGGGARRQRRPGLECQPRHGCGRRRSGRAEHPDHGIGRAAGRVALDGPRRVVVGPERARALRAPDRDRARRTGGGA